MEEGPNQCYLLCVVLNSLMVCLICAEWDCISVIYYDVPVSWKVHSSALYKGLFYIIQEM
jgi:hypothetical protein